MSEPEAAPARPLDEPRPTGDPRLDALARLIAIVDRLREPGGCPWDREQTVASMAPSLVEEAHEALEAIDRGEAGPGGEPDAGPGDGRGDGGTVEELGDLLMVIVLITRIASEERRFDLAEVARAVGEKLIRRHPHVFGDVEVDGSEVAIRNWERIKQAERREKEGDASALAGVPVAMPALQRAERIASKAIAAGFRWSDERGALAKLVEEVDELRAAMEAPEPDRARLEEELGDVCLAAAFLGRYLRLDPEKAARSALRRFDARFRIVERELGERLGTASLEELVEAWRSAKAAAQA